MVFLLIIIYIAFISLGLPDSLLGSAWPSMYLGFGVSIGNAGFISMVIAFGTIISSLFSYKLINRFGTGLVTFASVSMTAIALMGFSFSNEFIMLCVWAVPLGLGAGSVDAALNNFVAVHYKATHMNWLHCFWGLGATAGPIIMSYCLARWDSWKTGYGSVGIMQLALSVTLFFTLPLWKKAQGKAGRPDESSESNKKSLGIMQIIKLPGAKQVLAAFFCYCSIESTVGLWGGSYLVTVRSVSADIAARWVSLYYFGITLGRLLSGFLTIKMRNKLVIQLGQSLIGIGVLTLLLPFSGFPVLIGLFLVGLGCAPVYPCLIHDTPANFGNEHSQEIMGIQMASAYVGTTLMPPLFGLLAGKINYSLFPFYVGLLLIIMVLMVCLLYRRIGKA